MVTQNSANNKTGAAGKVLQGQGVGTASDFSTATYPSTAGTSGYVLTSDGTNWLSSPAAGDSFLLLFLCGQGSPSDSTTYYIQDQNALTGATATSALTRYYIPIDCTLKSVYLNVRVSGTLGTSETSTVSVRLNNTSNTTITSALTMDGASLYFNNTAMSLALVQGDYIDFIIATPAWVTNPTLVQIKVSAFFQGSVGAGGASPLTTKGDLYTYSTVDARLGVGTNNFALTPASGETTGLKWVPGPYLTRVNKSASYSVDASTDYLIAYTSTAAAYTVTLPAAPATGQVFIIKDESGAASINNIAITVSGGAITIDGSTTQYLNSNYGSVAVYFNGTNYFFY